MSDGTAVGSYTLQDVAPGTAGSNPHSFVLYDSGLFFGADDGVHDQELLDGLLFRALVPSVMSAYATG